MDEPRDLREEIVAKMRDVAKKILSRSVDGFILGVRYREPNEDGRGNLIMIGDPVVELSLGGKIMNLIVDDLFVHHKDDPKTVLGMVLQSIIESNAIGTPATLTSEEQKKNEEDRKKIEDSLKDIKIDDDLKKKLEGDVPGLGDLLDGK